MRRSSSWGSPDTATPPEGPGDTADRLSELVRRLASEPRPAGSDAEREARLHCVSRLHELGFETREENFSYSQFPARFGPLVCAVIFAGGILVAGHLAAAHGKPMLGTVTALAAIVTAGIVGRALLERTGTMPVMRRAASNLIAVRQGSSAFPTLLLTAHTDSKSQTIGMLARVASVTAAGALTLVFLGTLVAQTLGLPAPTAFPVEMLRIQAAITSVLTALAVLPLALTFITNESRGALDNATGVAAVLGALEEIPSHVHVGVVLTSAEEFALAGARAFAAAHVEKGTAINCDTVDDSGRFICMTSDSRSRSARAVARGGSRVAVKVHVRHALPGILTDSMALGRGGWDSCTLSRGNLGTLARVHTSRDEPARLDGAGVALAARILAATIEELS